MAVRPFYVEAEIEGRVTPVKGGPKSKHGSIHTEVFQRNQGEIDHILTIKQASVKENGKHILKTQVIDTETQEIVFEKSTNY